MTAPTPHQAIDGALWRQLLACAGRVARLLAHRRLHIDARVPRAATLPDGRRFQVFRRTSCDSVPDDEVTTIAVWFHLRGVPAGARIRRWLFERESILNTVLYAGADGYRVKLWMVDPETSDYAGLYEWNGLAAAERYGRYINAVLRPLSTPDSVGFETVPNTSLEDYLGRRADTIES